MITESSSSALLESLLGSSATGLSVVTLISVLRFVISVSMSCTFWVAFDERTSIDGTALEERTSMDGTALEERPSTDGIALEERPSTDGAALEERTSIGGARGAGTGLGTRCSAPFG